MNNRNILKLVLFYLTAAMFLITSSAFKGGKIGIRSSFPVTPYVTSKVTGRLYSGSFIKMGEVKRMDVKDFGKILKDANTRSLYQIVSLFNCRLYKTNYYNYNEDRNTVSGILYDYNII